MGRPLILALICAAILLSFITGAALTWIVGAGIEGRWDPFGASLALGQSDAERKEAAAILWEAWDILESEFINPEALRPKEMVYGAIQGMISTLGDPYTSFAEPKSAAIMDEDLQGAFGGIGASVRMQDGRLIIEGFLPISPAREAGLQEGDAIIEVDGTSLEGLTSAEAISLIRGAEGSTVTLLVERQGVAEPFTVSVKRARVEVPVVEAEMLEGNIAYVHLAEFNAMAKEAFDEVLADLMSENPRGLVLDLRNNPGGLFQAAVDIAGEFLPDDTVVVIEEQRGREPRSYATKKTGSAADVPLVVLINEGSASASEIVAGALRDHGRATLVGQRTFGKGSVQNVYTLSDGSSLRVTVARYYLPSGQDIEGVGIAPDVEVSYSAEDAEAGRDPQLERAIALLRGD